MKKAYLGFEGWYARHFIKPHFDRLEAPFTFVRPWHVRIFGTPIRMGADAHVIGSSEGKVRLSVWSDEKDEGGIFIGKYGLICPGVRISSACRITMGDNCMIASGAYITDADWHGVYDRVCLGRREPVAIADNVWIGDRAIVCKGVSIGENSIVGTGAVVTGDIPANAIAAGNPARVVKELDPNEQIKTRDRWLSEFHRGAAGIDRMERALYRENTFRHYLRYLINPKRGD